MQTITRILRRPIENYGKARLGAVAIAAIVAVLAAALGLSSLGIGKTSYEAQFAQAAGLSRGDLVTVAGVHVGTVTGLALEGDHVKVTMDVDSHVHLGPGTQASIKLTTLLGSHYVELRPGGVGDLPQRRIALSHTEVPYDLQQALQDATATFEAVDAEKIAQSLTTLADQVRGAPEILPEALRNVERLSSVIAERRDQVGSLLTNAQQVTDLIGRQQQSLGVLVKQGHLLMGDLAARRQLIVRLLGATTKLVNRLRPVLIGDRHQIDQLIANVNGMVQSLGKNDALFRNILQVMPLPLRNFTNATGNGDEFDFTSTGGDLLDEFMCGISARAPQFNLPQYFKDCE